MLFGNEANVGETRLHNVDHVLTKYLDALDKRQREVDDIRNMHHEIWKRSSPYRHVIQHRAGSRVEKQTRITGLGKHTDIDFMFEIDGLTVSTDESTCMYLKSSESSKLFGRLYVKDDMKTKLQCDATYSSIFSENVFKWDKKENAFLIIPSQFRNNVMDGSGFEYDKDPKISENSPSVSGKGIVNEYDAVPCLRLKEWPQSMIHRRCHKSDHGTFNENLKKSMSQNIPIFLVPTGNPLSYHKDAEFRLSFSMAEVQCFLHLDDHIRKLFGITKFVFQSLFGHIGAVGWYHMKHLLFNLVYSMNTSDLHSLSPLQFVFKSMTELEKCLKNATIQHFFMQDCNIFPTHKLSTEIALEYSDVLQDRYSKIVKVIEDHLQRDLKLRDCGHDWLERADCAIEVYKTDESIQGYVDGYLTRLLSVIGFSLLENENTISDEIKRVHDKFRMFQCNKHIPRMIPMVNSTIRRIAGDEACFSNNMLSSDKPKSRMFAVDKLSAGVHVAMEERIQRDLAREKKDMKHFDGALAENSAEFGIGFSVSKYHKSLLQTDGPLQHAIRQLEKLYGKCPRFYLHPVFLSKHLQVLPMLVSAETSIDDLSDHLNRLEEIAGQMSPRTPYTGKLSYKFSSVCLLLGYEHALKEKGVDYQFRIDLEAEMNSLTQKIFVSNFDLR